MKILIRLRYQILLIPLTFVFTCVFTAINYAYWGKKSIMVKTLFVGLFIGIVCYDFIPAIITSKYNIASSFFESPLYFYLVSVPASLYFIHNQNKYMKQHEKNDK